MFARAAPARPAREPGESPFWISYSDLMTALMSVFLLVMCVTLLAVTRSANLEERRKVDREQGIEQLMTGLREASRPWPQVRVDVLGGRIDLGDLVRFERGRHEVSVEGAKFLRGYVAAVLEASRTELGRRWIRRISVEGFADQDGDYLFNLGLSLSRSREVMCALFRPQAAGESELGDARLREVRDLFLVGGHSFNESKASKQASRRVELKLEFWQLDEAAPPATPVGADKAFGRC